MNNLKNKSQSSRERRILPFFVEFVKFSSGFAAIVAVALLTLHMTSVAMN